MPTLNRAFPGLLLNFLTVHRAKGTEADYVVVIDVIAGRLGFPSGVSDDPLLSLVLAAPDAHDHAEERRLFYVALTRARHRVFVLSRETQQSPFVAELLGPEYHGLVEAPATWCAAIPCPDCLGTLTRRSGKNGQIFFGCVNYPYCEGRADVCAVCQEGALLLEGTTFHCSRPNCAGRADQCPRCRAGRLVRRTNTRSGRPFWGCTRWKRDEGCTYTVNA